MSEPSDSPTQMPVQRYVDERLQQYQTWYDRKAVTCKSRYLGMRALAVAAGAMVPVLINLSFPFVRYLTTALSLVVVLVVSLESVYHYREQWKNYRTTEQYLGRERTYFQTRTGPYEGATDMDAYRLLVTRVEGAITAENAATLSTMTLASEVPSADHRGS